MPRPFRVRVYGKAGCDKCAVLNQRLDRLLEQERWQDVDKEYCDILTEDGLVTFCETECINPQRIPAMVVTRWNDSEKEYEPISARNPGVTQPEFGKSHLYHYVGLQTDYSRTGRGVITPKMIQAVLDEAMA